MKASHAKSFLEIRAVQDSKFDFELKDFKMFTAKSRVSKP